MGNPVSNIDPFGLDVFVCGQPAFGFMPVDHQWLKTDTMEAGMGGTRGVVPGNQVGDKPYDRVQTVSHAGRSNEAGASCKKLDGFDESKINESIKPGRPLGRWSAWNQCRSFVSQSLEQARVTPRLNLPSLPPMP